MVEIEFLDPGPWQDATPAPEPARPRRSSTLRRIRLTGPAVLWLAAAALIVIAPFQLVYSVSLSATGFGRDTHADGWGRLHQTNIPFAQHESRYGIVLCVAAGLFLIAAGLAVLSTLRRTVQARLASAGIGLAGAALAAGVIASALLYLQSLRDNIAVELRAADGTNDLTTGLALNSVHITTGWMVWLTAIAIGCGLAALVWEVLPVPERADAPAAPPVPEPAPHPRDELLDSARDGWQAPLG